RCLALCCQKREISRLLRSSIRNTRPYTNANQVHKTGTVGLNCRSYALRSEQPPIEVNAKKRRAHNSNGTAALLKRAGGMLKTNKTAMNILGKKKYVLTF